MTRTLYVLDTHALIWHLQDSDSLSSTARSVLARISAGKATGCVPSIVLVEMVYLSEKKRINPDVLASALSVFQAGRNFQLAPLDLAVVDGLREIPRSVVSDMPDRIVAATALAMQTPLLSKDSQISALDTIDIVW